MTRIQLPTGKTALVDSAWWYTASDDEIQRFYEKNIGSDVDPFLAPIPNGNEESFEWPDLEEIKK